MGKKRNNKRSKKKKHAPIRALVVFAVLLISLYFLLVPKGSPEAWSVSKGGILNYPQKRGSLTCVRAPLEGGEAYTLEKVTYQSKGLKVYGLLRIPRDKSKVPGMVLLPGAGVPKEGQQGLADVLRQLGYATLTLDQRGHGETDGYVTSIEEDYRTFLRGEEPIQHKMVYDALRAIDCMRSFPEIEDVYIAGESMGGRFAIIAGAIDPSIAGVIGISTAGYRLPATLNQEELRFFKSIDPNTYVSMISPRGLVMIHSENDEVIPIQEAEYTISLAREPKAFYKITTKTHGYTTEMNHYLEKALRNIEIE
ncbi:MAG: alpha/beta fold hydrolase [Candidatus Hydrothermarchaeales archaeon]